MQKSFFFVLFLVLLVLFVELMLISLNRFVCTAIEAICVYTKHPLNKYIRIHIVLWQFLDIPQECQLCYGFLFSFIREFRMKRKCFFKLDTYARLLFTFRHRVFGCFEMDVFDRDKSRLNFYFSFVDFVFFFFVLNIDVE